MILAATVSCLVGALVVCSILPPRWDSTARVMLNYVIPDNDTGQVVNGTSIGYYKQTQQSLVTDYTVAGRVADQLGWLTEPDLIAAYRKRDAGDQRDFRHFLADLIITNTKDDIITGTNIMEIVYDANTAAGAQTVAEALRKAYIAASIDLSHQDAQVIIDWYTDQLRKAKKSLDDAVAAEAAFGRANGLVIDDRGVDVETAHLQALSQQAASPYLPNPPDQGATNSAYQLADTNSQLVSAEKTLGPNNPEVLQLKTKQAALQVLVAKDQANAAAALKRSIEGGAKMLQSAVEAQQQKVLSKSEQIGHLNQLYQDVVAAQTEYKDVSVKLSHFRELANSTTTPIQSMGVALTPKQPTFPNWLLIVPLAIVGGLGVGVFTALLMELLGRRVRTVDDLNLEDDVPLICVIAAKDKEVEQARRRSRGIVIRWPWARGAVNA